MAIQFCGGEGYAGHADDGRKRGLWDLFYFRQLLLCNDIFCLVFHPGDEGYVANLHSEIDAYANENGLGLSLERMDELFGVADFKDVEDVGVAGQHGTTEKAHEMRIEAVEK